MQRYFSPLDCAVGHFDDAGPDSGLRVLAIKLALSVPVLDDV